MTNEGFYATLFEPYEIVTFAGSIYSCLHMLSKDAPHTAYPYICINPTDGLGRKDENVTAYRNILIEFDKLPLAAQLGLLETVPYSTLVFSGSKSYHAIISLEIPCHSEQAYRELVRRVQVKLPDMDKATSNPARLSRTPDAIRDNGVQQKLYEVKGRVSSQRLEDWLGPATIATPKLKVDPQGKKRWRIFSPRTRAYLRYGEAAFPDGRNNILYAVSCDLARCGLDIDEILSQVIVVCTLPQREISVTIRSAIKNVNSAE